MNAPLREVHGFKFYQSKYSKPGSGSNFLLLECKHEVRRKSSIKIPQRVRCRECATP